MLRLSLHQVVVLAGKVQVGVSVTGSRSVSVGGNITLSLSNYSGPTSIIWRSSDSNIATVSGNGKSARVHGVKAGSCTISTSFSGATIRTSITVTGGGKTRR